MASRNVLRWRDGRGWLVLSGGSDLNREKAVSDIRALTLERAAADGGVAYITLNAAAGSAVLTDMEDLGAPSGYLVDVMSEDDDTIRALLAEASVVVIEDGVSVDELRSGLMGAAVDGMQAAFEHGAVILAEGAAAMLMGNWVILESGELKSGMEWIENALIMSARTRIAESEAAKGVWAVQPMAIAVGIGAGSALVLGPDGEVELWGQREVTIALGPGYNI